MYFGAIAKAARRAADCRDDAPEPWPMLLTRFKEKGTPGTEAIVLWFDLEGFSRFFTQPDVHLYAPQYLNIVFSSVQDLFAAKAPAWCKRPGAASPSNGLGIREPDFAKFTPSIPSIRRRALR
jgi:hypothetical protein